jgi:hypothetical protein
LSAPRAPQSPFRQNRTGHECLANLGCGWARTRPDDVNSNLRPRTGARIGAGRDATLTESVAAFLRSAPLALSPSATAVRRDGAFPFPALSAQCRDSIRQSHYWVPPAGCASQTLNAPTDHCQISLREMARTALTHRLVNGFGCQRTAAPLAPCCNGAAQSFFPWAAPIPRGTKKPRSAPSSTALRPCGCSSASPCL